MNLSTTTTTTTTTNTEQLATTIMAFITEETTSTTYHPIWTTQSHQVTTKSKLFPKSKLVSTATSKISSKLAETSMATKSIAFIPQDTNDATFDNWIKSPFGLTIAIIFSCFVLYLGNIVRKLLCGKMQKD